MPDRQEESRLPMNSPEIPLPYNGQECRSPVDDLLNRFTHFGVELGLERIQRLLQGLGNPQEQVPILHVAGSNGKGSVCAYLSAILTQAGYRVGRYTSPHLVDWTERICLNERAIAPSDLHILLQQVVAAIQPNHPSPTQFEVITAAAWLYFAQQQVDVAVMEVGLGGRLDATNVCDRPLVSIITSLSREHWQRLGPTLAAIAGEKAGILKPGSPAIIGPLPPEAEPVVRQRIADVGCPAVWIEPARDLGNGWGEWLAEEGASYRYPLALPGAHQLTNSALAIATIHHLQQQGWSMTEQAIVQGMQKTRWPARLQWTMWQGRSLLIDGAHNSAGARVLRHYVDTSGKVTTPVSWVMGMVRNKDHDEVFRALLRPGDRLYLVPVPDHITAAPADLSTLAGEICPGLSVRQTYPTILPALEAAFQQRDGETTVVFCGSLYLIGHFFRVTGLPVL